MMPYIIIGFLLASAAIIAALVLVAQKRISPKIRNLYLAFLCIAICAAFYSSYIYVYFSNPNTRFHGWPVPYVVFQRDDVNSPWLDFIGPPFLSYPMNLILFLVLPSILLLVWKCFRPTHKE
jgi:hypothetical protein